MAKRKPKGPPKKPEDERLAEILTFAAAQTPKAAAAKFSVSERSIWRWRAAMAAGKLPGVADLVSKLKADALEECKDELSDAYRTSLELLKNKMPAATYRELLDTVTAIGELKAFRDGIAGDERGPAPGTGSVGQKGQGANPRPSGGAGETKPLRIVG
jgi:hypothetical protein